MFNINVDIDRAFALLVSKDASQLPFATAVALTRLAKDSQAAVRATLPKHFTVRNRYIHNAVKFTKATKSSLESTVGFADNATYGTDFMEKQETGGVKTSILGGHIAVPASSRGLGHQKTFFNSRGIIKRSMRPKALLNKEKLYFKAEVKGVLGIWKRTGKEKTKGGYPKPHLNLMYLLTQRASIDERLGMMDTVQQQVVTKLYPHFAEAMTQAMGSARGKSNPSRPWGHRQGLAE